MTLRFPVSPIIIKKMASSPNAFAVGFFYTLLCVAIPIWRERPAEAINQKRTKIPQFIRSEVFRHAQPKI